MWAEIKGSPVIPQGGKKSNNFINKLIMCLHPTVKNMQSKIFFL